MLYGREIPDYRTVRDQIDRLIAEGEANRQARAARPAGGTAGMLGFVRAVVHGRQADTSTRSHPRHAHR